MKPLARGGMGAFVLVLTGEVASVTGSGLTSFGIGVQIFQQSQSVTHFALVALSTILPLIALSPIAGEMADRFDRRKLLIAANLGSAVCSLGLFFIASRGRLEPWHVYPVIAMSSAFAAVIWPTMTAATTMLVRKAQFGRASGMTQTGAALSEIIAPFVAGILLVRLGLPRLILIDLASFLFAVTTLLLVTIPAPEDSEPPERAEEPWTGRLMYGWRFIREREGLLRLLSLFCGQNFCFGLVQVLITPLILSFASAQTLGAVLSIAAGGLLLGGGLMSVWGGTRRRVELILGAMVVQSLLLMTGGLRSNVVLITVSATCFLLAVPVIVASSQALWQSKVPPSAQGRVFATRRMIAGSTVPVAFVVAGPLSDYVFEPLMAPEGPLASTVGRLLGTGPGRGIGLLFIVTGIGLLVLVTVAFRSRSLRRIEDEIPDAFGEHAAESGTRREQPDRGSE